MWFGIWVMLIEILVMLFFILGDMIKILGDEINVLGKLILEKMIFLWFGLLLIEDFFYLYYKLNVFKCGINY